MQLKVNMRNLLFFFLLFLSCCKNNEIYNEDVFKRFDKNDLNIVRYPIDIDVYVNNGKSIGKCKEGDLFNYYKTILANIQGESYSRFLYEIFNQKKSIECEYLGFCFELDSSIVDEYKRNGINTMLEKYYSSSQKKMLILKKDKKYSSIMYYFFINGYTVVSHHNSNIENLVRVEEIIRNVPN